jgi:hypothetical protein
MRKVMFLVMALVLMMNKPSRATDVNVDELLSLANLTKETATQSKVNSLLGTPAKVEENKKWTWWYYSKGNANMVICWNKKTDMLEKVSYTSEAAAKSAFDTNLSHKLKSGITDITQALKLLGTPKDMTIKEFTQEVHYAYQNNVLRLFFRNRTLVDFCLY